MASSDFYIADNSDMENKKLEAARNHYMTGDYQAALKLYLSLLNTNISYKLYHRIGKCYYKMGDMSQAEEFFQKSVGLEKTENPSYYYLGNIYYKKEDLKAAIYYWCCAFAYKPEDENVSMNLATSYFSRGMKFQSVYYYEKFLKYSKEKGDAYKAVKISIDKCNQVGAEFLQKAKHSLYRKDNKSALEFLNFAVKNQPASYDINYLLGSTYMAVNDNMHALIYLKQAYCMDNKSLDVLKRLASVYINIGDYTAAYCTMRRLLPLVINNQQEYLKNMQIIKDLDSSFDELSFQGHLEWGDRYYEENNYHLALFEYENCSIMKETMQAELSDKIEKLRTFINPEARIIKTSLDRGNKLFEKNDFRNSNKYFSKVMLLSREDSSEYKLAKSKIVNA